jgi:shikimate kinase
VKARISAGVEERLGPARWTGWARRSWNDPRLLLSGCCAVVLDRVVTANSDCVIALPPSGLRDAFLRGVPGVTVAIHDTPDNIMERITFYDIDSRQIEKHLTDEERRLYLKEIKADISYFKRSYERADLHVTIAGLDPEASAAAVDARLGHT